MENTVGNTLFDLLVTRDFEPELLDSSGKPVTAPADAELFSFDWKTKNNNYGTVVILLGSDNELEIYYGDNLGRGMATEDRSEWYKFLEQMKNFASRNLMTFELNNISRLKYTMQGMAAIKEGLFESFYGRRNISYSDGPKQTKLVIKHSRNLGEGEARFRAIESLFVETADGERFKVPSRSLAHGRMLERHIAEGGTPYDALGQHINEIMNEMSVLGRFLRAAKNRNFSGNVDQVVTEAVRHYQALKTKVKRMISQRGYSEERENFDPTTTNESTLAVEQLRSMFIEQTLDHRIEEALPMLARLAAVGTSQPQQPVHDMKELSEFAGWMDSMTEQTPTAGGDDKRLDQLMAQEITAGPDGVNAIEQLSGTDADDEQLFDRIRELSSEDPDAVIWDYPGVKARLQQMGIDVDSVSRNPTEPESMPDPELESDPESDPGMAADIDAAAQDFTREALDSDGIMMTRPSNMSSESVERSAGLQRMIELINR